MTNSTPLSNREIELLKLVATGASNKEIAAELQISINTVKVHLRNIFAKLEVVSRTEAAMWAVQNGLIPAGDDLQVDQHDQRDLPVENLTVDEAPSDAPEGVLAKLIALPARARVSLLGSAALILILLGFGVSRLFQQAGPTAETASLPAAMSAEEFEASRWKRLADMPTARAGLAAAAYDNHIYAIAGEGVTGPVAANERYDPQTDTWETLAPKPIPVQDVHAGVVGGRIYIPGGQLVDGSVTDVMEVYDPRTDSWSVGARLPQALSGYAMTTFEGKLYLFGGWDGEGVTDSVYIYDPDDDEWLAGPPLPTARAYAGAAEAGGKIYVIGGWDGERALGVNEGFISHYGSSELNPWRRQLSLAAGRYSGGTISVANIIYIIGGDSFSQSFSLEYSPQHENWSQGDLIDELSWSRLGLVYFDTELFLLGGVRNVEITSQAKSYIAIYTIALPIIR